MSWTDERVGVLKKLWMDGLSASQIALELGGVTRNAVIGKVHRLGLSAVAKPHQPQVVVDRSVHQMLRHAQEGSQAARLAMQRSKCRRTKPLSQRRALSDLRNW